MKIIYNIDGKDYPIDVDDSQEFVVGDNIVLSNEYNDISYTQSWYDDGYTIKNIFTKDEFNEVVTGINDTIKKIISDELDINTEGFSLEKYHHYVKDDNQHFKIVSKTRDLFESDFNFNIKKLLPKFESILGFNLSDVDINTNEKIHIIVRINRPNSNDYNPPHKDMYESYDEKLMIDKFINFWIPICGVTNKSSLPIVPKSHIINESLIERTVIGGKVSNNTYRVRYIKHWADNKLYRTNVGYSDSLIFSSHLIHGLAINSEDDLTRVALEFRLFKKNTNL